MAESEKCSLIKLFSISLFLFLFILQPIKSAEKPIQAGIAEKPLFNVNPSVISETIDHGSSSIVDVTVSNYGNVNMTNITISKSGSIQDWMTLSTTNLDTIIPLGSKEFNVTISVPSGASSDTYSSEIFIECNETENVTIPVEVDVPSLGTTTPSGNGDGDGDGGRNGGTGGVTTSTTTIVTTTILVTTTTTPTTTVTTCALAGQACSSDLDCCYGYCCDNICSDEECEGVTKINTMYIALIVIGVSVPTGYYVYKKYYKKKIPVKIKPVIPVKAPVEELIPVVKPTAPTPPPAPPTPMPVQKPVPKEVSLKVKFRRELESLRMISQKLRERGYDTTEIEDELSLAENALSKNLPELSITHLNRIKQLLRKK